MVKARLVFACWCLFFSLPLPAFEWATATSNGREYVTLQSFCAFYGFTYQEPAGNQYFLTRNAQHTLRFKLGTSDMYLDGVHYVMSFPIESQGRDWLVSRMDVIKLFEPVLRPTEIDDRHAIRGVVIDAGHGGSDNGATSRLGAEKNYTLDTAFILEGILREVGLKTVLTRRNDVFVDLYERANIAAQYRDFAFVSIHFNSATEEAHGLETYCLSPRGAASTSSAYLTRSDIQKLPGNDYDASNILLASMVHSEIIRLNPGDPSADRGVKRARFVVIKQNVLPAILVEGGFVSNRMEAARVNRPDYRHALAEAIARGIIRFVNVMGDRNLPLPGGNAPPSETTPAPRAMAVKLPPAPSGIASEVKSDLAKPVTAGTASTATTSSTGVAHSSHKKKKKTPAVAAATTAGTSAPASTDKPATHSGSALGLADPAVPSAAAVSDKGSAEPDEPPTVNIYHSEDSKSSSSTP